MKKRKKKKKQAYIYLEKIIWVKLELKGWFLWQNFFQISTQRYPDFPNLPIHWSLRQPSCIHCNFFVPRKYRVAHLRPVASLWQRKVNIHPAHKYSHGAVVIYCSRAHPFFLPTNPRCPRRELLTTPWMNRVPKEPKGHLKTSSNSEALDRPLSLSDQKNGCTMTLQLPITAKYPPAGRVTSLISGTRQFEFLLLEFDIC